MERANPSGAKLASGMLGGGVVAGLLLSLAVPTTMKRQGSGWRDLIPAAAAVEDESSKFWMEAPPQDLTPVAWQPAEDWNEPQWADDGWTPYVDEPIYRDEPLFEADLPVPTTAERVYGPARVNLARVGGDESAAADAAAASAEAARMAAADVRMEIAAASDDAEDYTREPRDFESAFGAQ